MRKHNLGKSYKSLAGMFADDATAMKSTMGNILLIRGMAIANELIKHDTSAGKNL